MEYIPHSLIPLYYETCMQAKIKPYIRRVKQNKVWLWQIYFISPAVEKIRFFHSSVWFESLLGTSVLYRLNTLYLYPYISMFSSTVDASVGISLCNSKQFRLKCLSQPIVIGFQMIIYYSP